PDTPPYPGQRFDFRGGFVLGGALLGFTLGLTLAQERGFGNPVVVGLLAVAVVLFAAFVAVEKRHPHPMIDLRLFSNPLLSASVITGFLTFVTVSAVFLLMPFYLQNVLGLPIREAGLVLAASPLALGIVAPMAGNLSDRVGVRGLTLFGLAVLTIAYARLGGLSTDLSIAGYLTLAIPIGIGMGVFQSPNNVAIMSSVPANYLGIGSGLLNITRLLGQITGAAALGTLWASRVRFHSGGTLPTGGATAAAASAQVAGLNDTFRMAAALLRVATLIGWWAFHRSRTVLPPTET
ncbi:MAG: MFS transporter, partial [Acidimicrobiia bacterium]|nr:MFS transporter [Acidimicrobiia bacterium]